MNREPTASKRCKTRTEKEQKKRLLQDSGYTKECNRRGNEESIPQGGIEASSRYENFLGVSVTFTFLGNKIITVTLMESCDLPLK